MGDLNNNEARHHDVHPDGRPRGCLRFDDGRVVDAAGDGDAKSLALDQPQGKVSFLDWLATAPVTDDPVGDLVDDLRRDTRKPVDIESPEALRRYLRSRRACREALAVVAAVWSRYEAGG
jgi:hypothetical protein